MSAASSPAGRDFAMATSDLLFTTFRDLETAKSQLAAIRARAEKAGRSLGFCTSCHVVCRETDAEAEAYYRHYAQENADTAAVDFHIAMTRANRQVGAGELEDRVRRAAGLSSYPLVGRPEKVAEGLVSLHRLGIAGTTLSFVNFRDELPFFMQRVLPLLKAAGVRGQ